MEIVFRILWSVVLGGLIYGSAIWLLRVELSGDIERMEPGKAWLLGGLAWINAVVILVIGGMDGRLPEENRLVILGAQGILCSLLAGKQSCAGGRFVSGGLHGCCTQLCV